MDEIEISAANQQLDPRKWVTAYADYLYAYAIARVNDENQARDLVQDTFLAALQSRGKFAGKSSERTWLTAILKNKIYDVYRKKSTWIATEGKDHGEDKESDFFYDDGHWKAEYAPQPFGVDNFDPLAQKELNAALNQCLQKLPPLWLSVFRMKIMEDETTELVCTELKLTPGNFWVIMHRAKLNLRACLQKNWM